MPEFPRRMDKSQFVPAETAISDVVDLVEEMGADTLLTEAIVLLSEAKSKIADYVDKQ